MPTGRVERGARATIRGLKQAGRLTATDEGLVSLALETARAFDEAANEGAKHYARADLARVHLATLVAILDRCPPALLQHPAMASLLAAFEADP